ncbi:hypothetical protein CO168_01375 [Candidatus Shapirobacteria bacterium CG_4_9_14_3_um_filter_36_12]|uniref:DUF2127 domain-containing protein n=5 Tax=Candidatus Shapironibacteriota TaxID=1752721 RepID=A0A1J5I2Z0_9BACT|nr:MAG: hypothetical protein AUK05_01110 [Candidatus Shapirobacteria bacterium CG2_30_35_20]PIV07852.1 MAG: hypothetical protein COS53_00210 [Candidatus Shapirobacteria bacterium CG03_land_8_20_14_0_80_35_14]PIX67977.1 MAG: hypothetical protein COZ41_02170 [Candidatus Shapirobacteria bacterium CG_4_10_14_3_um_filter_35_13]PJA51141.1 MAG: hypothetical protein CO168_01375 [Candidatus Shapirobacteria bacterium CG_4_9_14_3_um_filter_36_12]PJE66859.1 MAG: hypothetical protein COU93_01990 [Candidatus
MEDKIVKLMFMKKNIWQLFPAIGYIVVLLFLLYTLVFALPTGVFVLLFVFVLVELVMVVAIIRRNIWAYRINILLLCLSIYGLFTSTITVESILSLAGELLVIPFYGEFTKNSKK